MQWVKLQYLKLQKAKFRLLSKCPVQNWKIAGAKSNLFSKHYHFGLMANKKLRLCHQLVFVRSNFLLCISSCSLLVVGIEYCSPYRSNVQAREWSWLNRIRVKQTFSIISAQILRLFIWWFPFVPNFISLCPDSCLLLYLCMESV